MPDPAFDAAVPAGRLRDRFDDIRRASDDNDRRSRAFQPPNPAKAFSAGYLLTLAGSLDLNQISVLLEAEVLREQGLQLARGNRLAEAGEVLDRARALCAAAGLSRHADVAARSFQAAADAYLAYRAGDHAAAVRLLDEAIETCRVLGDEFGHDMEFRKVHLGRNILRARCFLAPGAEILGVTVAMLDYILGDDGRWPCAGQEPWAVRRPLTTGELLWSVDETFSNLAMAEVDLAGGVVEAPVADAGPSAEPQASTRAAALAWARAMIADAEADTAALLIHGRAFLERDPGGLRHMKALLMERLVRHMDGMAAGVGSAAPR